MFWFVLYVMVSIVMSTFYTITICKNTELDGLCLTTRICFVLYFCVANLFTWPIYTILAASVATNDM